MSYAGDWLHNKRHGFGTQTYKSGKKYQGDFKDGRRDGTGTLWVPEKGKLRKEYSGQWKANKRHGVGVHFDAEGNKYEGNWANGKRNGRGKLFCANGDVYEGEFVADQRSGLGILTLSNGDRFEGHWLADQKEGPGRFFFASTCKLLQAEWAAGQPTCGVFSEWSHEGAAPHQDFQLPGLELEDPDVVLSEAFKESRRKRTEQLGQAATAAREAKATECAAGSDGAFTDEELDDICAAFDAVDSEGHGLVFGAQLAAVLNELGIFPDEEDVDQLLDEMGADRDSEISLHSFVGLLAALRAPDEDNQAQEHQ